MALYLGESLGDLLVITLNKSVYDFVPHMFPC